MQGHVHHQVGPNKPMTLINKTNIQLATVCLWRIHNNRTRPIYKGTLGHLVMLQEKDTTTYSQQQLLSEASTRVASLVWVIQGLPGPIVLEAKHA